MVILVALVATGAAVLLLDPLARSVPGLRSSWLVTMARVASTFGNSGTVYLVAIGIGLSYGWQPFVHERCG